MRMRWILSITALISILGSSISFCQTDQLPQQQPAPQSQQQPNTGTQSNTGGQQSVTPGQPIPAINPSTGQPETPAPETSPVDNRPIAGAEDITPELPGSTHSYLLPSFSVYQGLDSNAQLVSGTNHFVAATVPTGFLDMNVAGRSNQLSINFGGGGLLYDSSFSQSAGFAEGGFTDTYSSRRWSFLFSDRVSYLPEASGGFAGIGFGGGFNNAPLLGAGSGPGALNPIFTPGQSVLTGQFAALSNVSIAQAQYAVNPTNSIAVTGSFGIQHYAGGNNLQSSNDTLTVFSWDHQLTSTDSISVSYSLVRYRYNGGTAAVNDNLFRLGYAKRISQRMTFIGMVGPQLIYSTESLIPGTQHSVSVTGQASLNYRLQRMGFVVSYMHYVSPGSGVFQGANTDIATLGTTVHLRRTWDLSLSGSESRNKQLAAYSVNPAFPTSGHAINYQYGTFRLSHVMGRYMRAFVIYELQHQTSGISLVPGSTSTTLFRHIIGIGFELHPRPVGL